MSFFTTPPFVSVWIIRYTEQGPKYLLLRRCCNSYLHGTWQMVTGKTEENETAVHAALRELKEETGLIPDQLYTADAVETFFFHRENKIISAPVFVTFVNEPQVTLAVDEHDTYEWLDLEEVETRLVWAEQRRVLHHIHQHFVIRQPNPMFLIDQRTCYEQNV